MRIIIFLLLFYQLSPQLSQNYKIPSYYGSRFKDFNLTGKIVQGKLSSFQWHPRIDRVEDIYYFANETFIFQIQNQIRTIIAGKYKEVNGITGGFQDGDLKNTLFKDISAIVYFRKNHNLAKQEANKKTIILINDSPECFAVTKDNYTKCEVMITPQPNDNNLYEVYNETSINLIKDIYMLDDDDEITYDDPYIFVSDRGNHCIRKIDLKKQLSTTFAGQCQKPGFKDGQMGVNLFNSPAEMGIDLLGNIFVYDEGNKYIRMIDPNGTVITLLNGACQEDVRKPIVNYQNVKIRNVLCYRNWQKISGEPKEHLLTQDDNMTICTSHYTECSPSG